MLNDRAQATRKIAEPIGVKYASNFFMPKQTSAEKMLMQKSCIDPDPDMELENSL